MKLKLFFLFRASFKTQLLKKQARIFATYVLKEFAHAFSCVYIELWMHLASLESTQEVRVKTSRVHP